MCRVQTAGFTGTSEALTAPGEQREVPPGNAFPSSILHFMGEVIFKVTCVYLEIIQRTFLLMVYYDTHVTAAALK